MSRSRKFSSKRSWAAPLLLSLVHGCCGKPTPPVALDIRAPDVLATREALQALHDPPRVTVESHEVRPGAGSQLCEKVGGAACVIGGTLTLGILPLLFTLTDDPPYDEFVVREGADTRYVASIDRNGRFMNALDRRGGVARQIGVASIPRLGKYVVVERARGPLAKEGSKGPDGPFTPTLLSTQYDVAADCEPELPKWSEGADRGGLIAECASALQDEANPFLTTAFAASNEATQASTLTALCGRRASPAARDLVLARFPTPSPLIARAGAACRSAGLKILPSLRAIATEACAAPTSDLPQLLDLLDRHEMRDAALVKALPTVAPSCPDRGRTILLGSVLGETTNPAALASALGDEDPGIPAFVAHLEASDKVVRKGMLLALQTSPHASSLAKKLAPIAYHPPDELLLIGLGFAKNPRLDLRASLLPKLRLLGFAETGLRPIVDAEAKAKTGSDEKIALRTGMVVAGRREHAANIAAALSAYQGPTQADLSHRDAETSLPAFVAQGLSLAGCSDEQIAALVQQPKVPDTKRGVLCTKPR